MIDTNNVRARAGSKGCFGANSDEYERAGGTWASDIVHRGGSPRQSVTTALAAAQPTATN